MESSRTETRFLATRSAGEVSAILVRPPDARALYVLAHGAGAGMRHAFLEAFARELAGLRIATFRWQFPYTEKGSKRPDPQPILLASVRSAVAAARVAAPDLPVFAGGKSMGGRMTSLAQSKEPLEGVRGLAFVGFPLHPAGKPSADRAAHLAAVSAPMLFLQGSRDALADLALLRPVCNELGARAELRIFEDADHSFHVRKSSGRTDAEVLREIATCLQAWMERTGKEARS